MSLPLSNDAGADAPEPPAAGLRSLSRGAAVNLAARVLAVLLGLAIVVLVARRGPQVQGAFALFVAVEAALLTLCSGLGLLLAREVSHRRAPPAPWLARLLAAALAAGVVAALGLAAWAASAEGEPYRQLGLLALAAPFLLLAPTASGLWLGQGRMLALNLPQVAAPALVLGGLLLVDAGAALAVVLVVWVAAKSVVGVASAGFAWRDARAAPPAAAAPQPAGESALRFVATVALTNFISLLNYRATLFIIEREAGLASAGVYSIAVQVAELLWLLSSAVTISAYHRIGAQGEAAAARTTLAAVRINLGATLLAAPLLYGAARWAVPAVLGADYAGALLPLMLLLPGVAAYAAASSLSAYYTNHRGRPQWSAAIAGLSLALTLGIAWFAVPRFGIAGAAAATSIGYAIAIAVGLRSFLRAAGLRWRALVAA
ncbi:MAG TPA: polysaccharide biosynthesis C-terminal domain-containing protein [Methylibium sp.]|uniref:lipopolysaccharide biosynthesis protein n=1 Tax=Methylibium sp. TaxID=2067992 RepID=UPI002DB6A6B5|nr:polysaccharide biosynthesis C-terminal domain-containing protein [Methylibium sp.]HEU4460743.1 polysaccharide biosynthesis C-terminal domain-containing protein [Methylibium sp.]